MLHNSIPHLCLFVPLPSIQNSTKYIIIHPTHSTACHSFVLCCVSDQSWGFHCIVEGVLEVLLFHIHHQVHKRFFDIEPVLGRCFQVFHPQTFSKPTGLFIGNLPLRIQIFLVPYQNLYHIFSPVLLYLTHPQLQISEGLFISNIINQQDSVRSFVVGG